MEIFETVIEEMEKVLGLPQDFYNGLVKEDDWSFIIKLHAIIESALTHGLTMATESQNLESIYARLPINNMYTGKLAFAKALNLLDPIQIKFIQRISDIRNTFVHDIKSVNMTLQDYSAPIQVVEFSPPLASG